ncbi:hypothetical protein YOLOSWAG_178 [Erwinia phage vB_EamM_Yoloswag]|uniref:Uncharacterized protein n=1 Tax=Erwinia phage vB_EamM_Yoloswag TaxID=1958956 RepID=A0A1S6L397_9CAUD|nr:hypothetical protein HOR66_gp178 [Erwinia phage vB_EamM_Yoloswag]AQT28657.1 hypothetical protein YOLOSWAG_178 [Erwinia phage vB_EamM_Yoloswag]
MAVQHFKVDRTFKENTYSGQYRANQMRMATPYVVDAILKQVLLGLISAQMPFTKAQNFTLVNVYAPDANMSMGYSNMPDPSVIMIDSGLVFTFCMKPRQNRILPRPNQINGRSRYFRLWGENNINEYVTIGVPRSFSFALNGNGLEFLTVLHNVVGTVSRNFLTVDPQPQYAARYITQDISVLDSQDNNLSVQQAMRNLPYTEWHYCSAMWKQFSVALSPELFDRDFPQYFCTYILSGLYMPDVSTTMSNYIDTKVADYIAKGLMKISAAMASGIPDVGPEIQTALYLLLNGRIDCSALESNQIDRTNFVRMYFENLNQNMQRLPEYQSKLVIAAASNHLAMARAILSGSYNVQLRTLAEYMALTEA